MININLFKLAYFSCGGITIKIKYNVICITNKTAEEKVLKVVISKKVINILRLERQ